MKKFLCIMLAIVMLTVLFAACGDNGANNKYSAYAGKYYEYVDGVKLSDSWIELKADGKFTLWNESVGLPGAFEINGGAITLSLEIDSVKLELTGTISDGVIAITLFGETAVFKKDGATGGNSGTENKYSAYAGKYYEYVGGEKKPDSWIELKAGGGWTDDNGFSGKFEIISGYITVYGEVLLMSGTISDGVITMSIAGETAVFKKDGATGGPDMRTLLTISVYRGGFGMAWLEAIAAEYEKANPDVKVAMNGTAQMEATAQAALESGNPNAVSDIFSCIDANNFYNNAAAGRLLNLDDLYAEKPDAGGKTIAQLIDPAVKLSVHQNGHYYGVPWTGAVCGIAYNYNMFKQKGWNVPQTFDEFWTLCDTIKAAGIAPFGYSGGAADGYMGNLFRILMSQYDGVAAAQAFLAAESAGVYNTQGRLKAYETIGKLLSNQNWILSGSKGYDHLAAQTKFIRGEVAMISVGSWLKTEMSGFLAEYPDFECAMMPIPWIDSSKKSLDGGTINFNYSDATTLIIPANAKHTELAKDFLKFASSKKMLQLYTEKTFGNPRPFTYEGVDLSGLDIWGKSLMDIYKNSYNVYSLSENPLWRSGYLAWFFANNGMLAGPFGNCSNETAAMNLAAQYFNYDYNIAQQIMGN